MCIRDRVSGVTKVVAEEDQELGDQLELTDASASAIVVAANKNAPQSVLGRVPKYATLVSVDKTDVAGENIDAIKELLRGAGRPVELEFRLPESAGGERTLVVIVHQDQLQLHLCEALKLLHNELQEINCLMLDDMIKGTRLHERLRDWSERLDLGIQQGRATQEIRQAQGKHGATWRQAQEESQLEQRRASPVSPI
eukprot:TRINITY_DN27181_c0_g1_i1.p1 TRINITY_DN27181_c0_g1~~TRINITY_DN27181_c0_g1_i1.p1  ORF type:complete len:197 (-),score=59.41 TRINITY_DN27181_c0_g1_i1:561-1151(-)